MTASAGIRVDAFAPAHVTGVFAPASAGRDPRGRGSIGAGIVLEIGVHAHAEFRPGGRRAVRVMAEGGIPLPISEEVARRLCPPGRGQLTVRLEHDLPIGQGFGMSAAGALATALAVGEIAGRSPAARVEVAHLADLFGGGGLGGVAAIASGGGLEFRTRPGIPPRGRVLHRPLLGSLFLGLAGGPLPSPGLLRSARFLQRVRAAAGELPELFRHPDANHLFEASERFTDRVALGPPELGRALRAIRRRGSWAAQSMFGRSFFVRARTEADRPALLRHLERAGLRVVEVGAATRGARVLRHRRRSSIS